MKIRPLLALAAAAAALHAPAAGAIRINEVLVDAPGNDDGLEFVELQSTTLGAESLAGLSFLAIDGDGPNAGEIDVVLSLASFFTGTNGLFLWTDGPTAFSPPPAPGTVINAAVFEGLENGSNTFLLVSNFSGALGNDLDFNNDGTIDAALPWSAVLDGISILDSDIANPNFSYAGAFGFTSLPQNATYTPDLVFRLGNGSTWAGADVTGTGTGPFAVDPAENSAGLNSSHTATPGNPNPIPEPSVLGLAVAGSALLALSRRRRR